MANKYADAASPLITLLAGGTCLLAYCISVAISTLLTAHLRFDPSGHALEVLVRRRSARCVPSVTSAVASRAGEARDSTLIQGSINAWVNKLLLLLSKEGVLILQRLSALSQGKSFCHLTSGGVTSSVMLLLSNYAVALVKLAALLSRVT